VGDSEVDAETAQRAQVPFIFYTEGITTLPQTAIPHDVAFSEFAELPGIVAGLIGSA
jgi:phosphoglycolate phosphatase